MQRNISNSDPFQPEDTETFLKIEFTKLVVKAHEKGDIPGDIRDYYLAKSPDDLDELEECYNGLLHCMQNKHFYQLIERIEKAETVIENEPDMKKRQFYIKKMKELAEQLEMVRPA